jgi:hypothetical protein
MGEAMSWGVFTCDRDIYTASTWKDFENGEGEELK